MVENTVCRSSIVKADISLVLCIEHSVYGSNKSGEAFDLLHGNGAPKQHNNEFNSYGVLQSASLGSSVRASVKKLGQRGVTKSLK